jgi:hypothetical protein
MRIKTWPVEAIEEQIVAGSYKSIKEWRIDNWASHLAASRAGMIPFFAAKYKLDYNPRMSRRRVRDAHNNDTSRV